MVAMGVPRLSLGFFPSLPYKERSPALQKNNWGHIRLVGKSLVTGAGSENLNFSHPVFLKHILCSYHDEES